jgi:hypothetical protein
MPNSGKSEKLEHKRYDTARKLYNMTAFMSMGAAKFSEIADQIGAYRWQYGGINSEMVQPIVNISGSMNVSARIRRNARA